MPAHLNRKQQREIKAVVERAKKDNGITQDRIALGFGNRAVIHGHIWNVLRLLYHVPGRYSGSVGDFFYCGR